ncbi:MAG: shikimate kinase, partial [Paracoccaceae bacterium]
DSDHEIERAAAMAISEIFARDGEPFFRARETEVIGRLMQDRVCILSTGGGAFMSEGNRALMSERGVSVWLDADLELLWSRVRHKDTRPLLRGPDPYGTLRRLYDTRVPIYAQADVTVRSEPGLPIEAMAHRVIDALARRPDVLEVSQ